MILNAYDVYKAQKTAFEALKTTYDTKKKEYEDAVEAKKTDPKKEVPTRPDMPSTPAAYSGPKFLLAQELVATKWASDIKTSTTVGESLLATAMTTAGVYSYDQAELATKFHNRVSYLMASATNAFSPATAYQYVGATWGRLGQGQSTMTANASPFLWRTELSTAKPGMMVSIFPDYTRGTTGAGYAKWTVTSANPTTISYKIAAFAAASEFAAPGTPTAAEAITVGAVQAAAATDRKSVV